MELSFVIILTLISLTTVCSMFLRPCRAVVFPSVQSSVFIRFTPSFLAGIAVIILEAVLILSHLRGLRPAYSFVWVTRTFAIANGFIWGVSNVRRTAKPLAWLFLPLSWLFFSGIMLLPVSQTLQLILLLSVVVISPPIWLIYAVTLILLYLGLKKGKLSGILSKIFRKHREDIDVFLLKKKGLLRMVLIMLLAVPVLLWIIFLAGTYLGWITIPGLR